MSDEIAQALWLTHAGQAEIRDTALTKGSDLVTVKTLYSGISRGTERLVFHGHVPPSAHATMRAPFQQGSFEFPLKYGYAAVGTVQDGERIGETVFALFPHQTKFSVPTSAAITVPDNVPAKRAVLAANMETALNILWDARISPGDRVAVIGAGVVGALVGYLSAKVPGTEVTLIDIDPAKTTLAKTLGCHFEPPENAPDQCDTVIHASATSAGLTTALSAAGTETSIIEASWYGTRDTTAPLGGAFHYNRLQIVASQVGRIPPHMTARWTYHRRLSKALALLADPALDCLVSGETAFEDLPDHYDQILRNSMTLCHRVRYT